MENKPDKIKMMGLRQELFPFVEKILEIGPLNFLAGISRLLSIMAEQAGYSKDDGSAIDQILKDFGIFLKRYEDETEEGQVDEEFKKRMMAKMEAIFIQGKRLKDSLEYTFPFVTWNLSENR